jgi:hypothetical protein
VSILGSKFVLFWTLFTCKRDKVSACHTPDPTMYATTAVERLPWQCLIPLSTAVLPLLLTIKARAMPLPLASSATRRPNRNQAEPRL